MEAAAARGHEQAIAALTAPAFPEALAYLWELFERLDTMRRVGMHGFERLSPSDVEAGLRLFDWTLDPHEVDALTRLDLMMLYPGEDEETKTPPSQDAPWPERKG